MWGDLPCVHVPTYAARCSGSLLVRVPSMSNSTPLIVLRSGTGGAAAICCWCDCGAVALMLLLFLLLLLALLMPLKLVMRLADDRANNDELEWPSRRAIRVDNTVAAAAVCMSQQTAQR